MMNSPKNDAIGAPGRPERMHRVSQDLYEGGGARVRSTANHLTKIRDRVWRNFMSAYICDVRISNIAFAFGFFASAATRSSGIVTAAGPA